MNYSTSVELTRNKISRAASLLVHQERGKEERGFAALEKGQKITGTVLAVGRGVTLAFEGQQITVPKEILKAAFPGEKKTFEVMSTSGNEIELRLLDEERGKQPKTFKAVMVPDTIREVMENIKDQKSKKDAYNKQYQDTKQKLEDVAARLTETDYRWLETEGFLMEELSVDAIYAALDRIKQEVDLKLSNQNMNKESTQQAETIAQYHQGMTGQKLEDTITKVLTLHNLPATGENITRITKALELSQSVGRLDDKAMKHLISQGLEPTIENIYKAIYSGTPKKEPTSQITEDTWKELQAQVKDIISEAGYEVNQESLATARWLLENQLPVTAETLSYKNELSSIKAIDNQSLVMDKIMEAMKAGILPKDVTLGEHKAARYQEVVDHVHSLQPETITKAIRQGTELTIKNLLSVQQTSIEEKGSVHKDVPEYRKDLHNGVGPGEEEYSQAADTLEEDYPQMADRRDSHYEEIKAKRQLEELRLKMTLEAAAKLEKKGISIETQRLEEVVEALRELEDSYYKKLLAEADTEATDVSIQLLKETISSADRLKQIPCYVLGSTLDLRRTQTITGLLSEGSKLQSELDKAGVAYETLMTVPNGEYGDSLVKAFGNMDSLLSEMNIDTTEENKRAVRVLAYNRMEITQEAIDRVKAYDLEVNTLMKNLHPAIAVRLIKEGVNPLEQPVTDLNHIIDQMREEQGITSEERFSTYLRKLEKSNQISQEERKAYIGIYRLLYNIEKSDGAALGTVLNSGRQVTLENLLSAVRTQKKGKLDAIIDDEFGTLQDITRKGESISEQLSLFEEAAGGDKEGFNHQKEEQLEYMDKLLKQLKEEASPEKLKETHSSLEQQSAGGVTGATATIPELSANSRVWEALKELPIEKLLSQLRSASEDLVMEDADTRTKVQELRELCKSSEQGIRFLNDFKMPTTPVNIMLANHLMSNGESVIKKLIDKNKNAVEKSEKRLKDLSELSDTIIDKHSMQEAYDEMEANAKEDLKLACSQEVLSSIRLAELKTIGQQMTFLRALAGKEFYQLPIETEAGITNLNLTILRGTQTSGKVAVSIDSEALGNVRAEFTLKGHVLKGYISSDSKVGLSKLKNNTLMIEQAAIEKGIALKQMDFILQRRTNDSYSYQSPESEGTEAAISEDTERTLYRMAKAIINSVQNAERSEE